VKRSFDSLHFTKHERQTDLDFNEEKKMTGRKKETDLAGSFSHGFMSSYYSKTWRKGGPVLIHTVHPFKHNSMLFKGPNSTQINFETDKQEISQNISLKKMKK